MLRAVLYISDSIINDSIDDSAMNDQVFEKEHIRSIKNSSKNINDDHQVTGVLAYHQRKIFHVLEGEPSNIDQCLDKIEKDNCNKNVSILIDINHEDRIYNDWEFIECQTTKQSQLLSKFLQENIDLLPMLEQDHHDVLEKFVINLFG